MSYVYVIRNATTKEAIQICEANDDQEIRLRCLDFYRACLDDMYEMTTMPLTDDIWKFYRKAGAV